MKKILLLNAAFLILLPLYRDVFAQAPPWQWAKAMGGTGDDRGNSITTDLSGNVYTTGEFWGTADFDPGAGIFNLTSNGNLDIFISKLDVSGNFIWTKAMGGITADRGYSIVIDSSSGNVYTTGHYSGTVDFDPGTGIFNLTGVGVFISKLDSSGNFVWAKGIGGVGSSITLDPVSGDVYTTGWFAGTADFDPGAGTFSLTASGGADIFVSKLDSSGNFIWAKAMGGTANEYGMSIALDASGGGDINIAGHFLGTTDFDPGAGIFNLTSAGARDIFVARLDNSGNFIWARRMGGVNDDYGNSIAVASAGNGDVYTSGYFQGTVDFDPGAGVFNLASGTTTDIFISKLNSSGNFVWAKKLGGTNYDYGFSIATDPAGSGIYTTGAFGTTADFDPGTGIFNLTANGSADIFVSRLDSSGNFVWAKSAGGTSTDYGSAITLDASGHVHLTGFSGSHSIAFGSSVITNADTVTNTYDVFIARLDTILITGNNNKEKVGNNVLAFPNPAANQFTMYDLRFTISDVDVYNAFGEKIFSQQPTANNQKLTIIVSSLPAGIYFVKVKGENEERITKFVKQ